MAHRKSRTNSRLPDVLIIQGFVGTAFLFAVGVNTSGVCLSTASVMRRYASALPCMALLRSPFRSKESC